MSRVIAGCQVCRNHILDSFAALAGISIRPLPHAQLQKNWTTSSRTTLDRPFSSSRRTSESQQPVPEKETNLSDQSSTSKPSASAASIPWYLQVQTPEPPAPISPHLALQDIPPIPEDAPPILSPILSHLSTQMGLDNLTLLDLRDVYPPPALGANLIMVLGTARSYKHLNTSADRFCRWLRTNYKLTPYADGLLGRNELKLKLRRKARRMRLAQSVGNTVAMGSTEGGDDGITTGWVCVNVGAVDGVGADQSDRTSEGVDHALSKSDQEEVGQDEDEYTNPPDETGVVGFGTRDQRPRVVVQMFTEEKRLEMDLEGLWDFREQRREKKEEKLVKRPIA